MKRYFVMLGTIFTILCLAIPAYATDFPSTPRTSWSVMNGRVYALAQSGNTVFLGGTFTSLRSPNNSTTVTRNHLAAIDIPTGNLLSWNPGASGDVRSLAVSGSTLFVGTSNVTALSTSSGSRSFTVPTNGSVRSLAVSGGTLFAGGTFTTVNSQSRNHLAALSTDSGSFISFSGSANGIVNSLNVLSNGTIAVGGNFTTLSGAAHSFLGSITQSGQATSWTPPPACSNCSVLDIDHDSTSVYVGTAGSGGRAAAYSATSNTRRWSLHADGDIQAVEVSGSTLYIGGHFYQSIGSAARAGIAATTTGGSIKSFAPRVSGGLGVWDILDNGSRLSIGGDFTNVQVNGSNTGERGYTNF